MSEHSYGLVDNILIDNMYDFLLSNNLILADFMYDQPVSYTYFSHSLNVFTWLDHIVIPYNDLSNVVKCNIVPHDPGNTSDHLPVSLTVNVCIPDATHKQQRPQKFDSRFSRPNWKSTTCNQKYKDLLEQKLSHISYLPGQSTQDSDLDLTNKK